MRAVILLQVECCVEVEEGSETTIRLGNVVEKFFCKHIHKFGSNNNDDNNSLFAGSAVICRRKQAAVPGDLCQDWHQRQRVIPIAWSVQSATSVLKSHFRFRSPN